MEEPTAAYVVSRLELLLYWGRRCWLDVGVIDGLEAQGTLIVIGKYESVRTLRPAID